MLDKNALAQLKTLKKEIHDSTPRFSGRVRATGGRFGFVNTDDGKQFFIAPDEMEKLLPGDEIDFRVEPAGEGKEQAIVEKLISSETGEFFGQYIIRGKGHFIEPDHPTLNRWIFVPPAARKKAQEGDFVRAHISKHPFPEGKVQATIDDIIGRAGDDHIENTFIKAKWHIAEEFSEAVKAEVAALTTADHSALNADRTDLTHLPFVTIDSANTRDIDDALYAEALSEGWTLWVAIADPAALITGGSELDKVAQQRTTSVYLPDQVIPMLPPELSEQLCSLQEGENRLAMVVELKVLEDGTIDQIHIHNGLIRSHAKLNYPQMAAFLDGDDTVIPAELHGPAVHLDSCAKALAAWRSSHCLLMDDRPDYKLITDEKGQVKEIVRIERNQAHRLVEECMLACNRSIARWLAEKGAGFFIEHAGVRTERKGEVAALLKEQLPLEQKPSLETLQDYVSLMQQADRSESELPLRMIVSRQLERSNLSNEAKPHFGLGFDHYTTFTSPLRKYNDLLIHRIVRSLLQQESLELTADELLSAIQSGQTTARMAAQQSENWLKLQWLTQQEKDAIYDAVIVHMNSGAITVRLESCGIEGSIDRRKAGKDWTFDTKTLSHRSENASFILGQAIKVKVNDIQPQARQAQFILA
ncbi:MAG: RNAse R [Oceanospirillaceae bacterium]|uniref:VacB/RNase II family 3'-5' exoribonuclease n=1 Tax=unclassified Thalassolituus TaxID=2624967 RepID=UPI000C09E072|nr:MULTISPECIES: VacB/RNase II family 3'-5' exoribonuclease [unclassified Thalassolituus]MAK92834.1 RNAse R [Thalassolituus sp.]MAS26112.1 RNAse R [Oceanospirillaceae bacterium]MAY00880.1 RNAse R [Oceanospirillaceae bacterium]MBS54584.1 RNAse R [Oceanospirillaceae bacterium]|tara:strand:+ start:1007 stop:2935 length:1929 start_codon:yes stop_codon:yes gene_type:complete